MRVAVIGPGRLGRTLALLLERAGVEVSLVGPGETAPPADIALLAVPDASVEEAARALSTGPVVLHCSGSLGVEVLRPHRPAGSLHPLMTFPGPEVHVPVLQGVPAAVDGDAEAVRAAEALAGTLGMRTFVIPGDRRLYHAAAVMAGNFSTVLLAEAARVLRAAGIEDPGVLVPLAVQSLLNAADDPAAALTGPAVRGDAAVLDAHRQSLKESGLKDVLQVYDLMSRRAERLAEHPDTAPSPLLDDRSPGSDG